MIFYSSNMNSCGRKPVNFKWSRLVFFYISLDQSCLESAWLSVIWKYPVHPVPHVIVDAKCFKLIHSGYCKLLYTSVKYTVIACAEVFMCKQKNNLWLRHALLMSVLWWCTLILYKVEWSPYDAFFNPNGRKFHQISYFLARLEMLKL